MAGWLTYCLVAECPLKSHNYYGFHSKLSQDSGLFFMTDSSGKPQNKAIMALPPPPLAWAYRQSEFFQLIIRKVKKKVIFFNDKPLSPLLPPLNGIAIKKITGEFLNLFCFQTYLLLSKYLGTSLYKLPLLTQPLADSSRLTDLSADITRLTHLSAGPSQLTEIFAERHISRTFKADRHDQQNLSMLIQPMADHFVLVDTTSEPTSSDDLITP